MAIHPPATCHHHSFFVFLWPRGVRSRICLSSPPPTWKLHQAAKTRRTQPSAAPTGAARSPATKACKRPAAARSAQLRGRPALLAAVDDVALMGALEVVLTLMAARAPALELAHATAKHQPAADLHTAVLPLANPTSAFSHHRVLRSRRRSSWRLRHQGVLAVKLVHPFMASVPHALLLAHRLLLLQNPPAEHLAPRGPARARQGRPQGQPAHLRPLPRAVPRALAHLHGALKQPLLMLQAGPSTTRGSSRSRRSATARLRTSRTGRRSEGGWPGAAAGEATKTHQAPQREEDPPQASSQPTASAISQPASTAVTASAHAGTTAASPSRPALHQAQQQPTPAAAASASKAISA